MRKLRLFTPGPTPLIPEAQLAMARPLIHHRTSEFKDLLLETRLNLQRLFKTTAEMVILTSSGTGAMEAAVSNLHAPGEKVLAVVAGKFGERWAEIAEVFGLECVSLCKAYGEAASPEEIVGHLRANPGVRSLLIQGCETSTGTSHDLEAIARSVRHEFPEILIIVDAISAVGCQPVKPDEWGLDVVISGSQKAFGLPPGLAFLSLGSHAVEVLESKASAPHYYLNLRKEVRGQALGTTAYTPAITLMTALNEATRLMLKEGLDELISGAELMARCARKGLGDLDFRLLSSTPSNAVTAAYPPTGIAADELRSSLESSFGVKVAGGQGPLKGKIVRIAHLGYFDLLDVFLVLSAIEMCLKKMGKTVTLGKGVSAAMEESQSSGH